VNNQATAPLWSRLVRSDSERAASVSERVIQGSTRSVTVAARSEWKIRAVPSSVGER